MESKKNDKRIQVTPDEHSWQFPIGLISSYFGKKKGNQLFMNGTGTIIS
jgi:hypothetical protein